ncbi:hypothetical protein C1752_00147 [Acaryochloris thomasi RCC1774]|uniref:Uncharacterized protein n=1 Tax=Acaryochloris thomasi RCC1774 TaxID=1764569 RepID=A0A2W1JNY6_9CYAN|nr:hypothetical protein [Acaryochloris thomasi]PZD75043.1 hypothetical protein C1752_00147 [Acaryochloris thomasi RCC1774]
MTVLNPATVRRLNKLQQTTDVWEGDRRPLPGSLLGAGELGTSDWVVWADPTHVVRAMDLVPAANGLEALVRTLIMAMESPQGPAQPARPCAVLVCDREIQFYLRGALQDLNIQVNYAPKLPLIDDICQELQTMMSVAPPPLPSSYGEPLLRAAATVWSDAPWTQLADHQILEISLDHGDLRTLYVSIMGLLEAEYGLLFYRTEASLRQFRQQMMTAVSPDEIEAIFLHQDCLFLNFDVEDASSSETLTGNLEQDGFEPIFGSIHPLEGMRAFLDEEEVLSLTVALDAFHRFWQRHGHKLEPDQFPEVSGRYKIRSPQIDGAESISYSVRVKTRPQLASELWASGFSAEEITDSLSESPILRQDLIPEKAFFSLGMIPWEIVEILRLSALHYQPGKVTVAGDGLPMMMVQTSRPKAKAMIKTLKAGGGIAGLGFNPGESPFDNQGFDLGLIKTADQQLQLFGEYSNGDPVHQRAKRKWNQRCKKTKGWCGFVIAQGGTGKSRGQPTLNDLVALFEVRFLSTKDFDLGTLQLMPQILS